MVIKDNNIKGGYYGVWVYTSTTYIDGLVMTTILRLTIITWASTSIVLTG
ncbi:MAG: hypothetical protein H6551_01270 [Chitinophagales bacterium]|nr:hypothetical protein [Chitinophagales bacterium]